MAFYQCPHCGENVDTEPDQGAGKKQQYIEDCPVCCRPNRISARYVRDLDDYVIEAAPEG
jgi:hypothetical protein